MSRVSAVSEAPYLNLDVPGWMTEPELRLLAEAARQVPDGGTIIEIGSFAGRSAVHLAANSAPGVRLFCIDSFTHVHRKEADPFATKHLAGDKEAVEGRPAGELFDRFTEPWAEKITKVAALSPPPSWDEPADLIFIDGDHTYDGVMRDLVFWRPQLKPGGRFLGHDWDDDDVRAACRAFAFDHSLTATCAPDTLIWEMERTGMTKSALRKGLSIANSVAPGAVSALQRARGR